MATPVGDLDLPFISLADGSRASRMHQRAQLPPSQWLARTLVGYSVWHYDDAVSILRDKRWHNAASRIAEIMGVTDDRFLSRQRESILSAEGDTHTRLRRLVAPAFTPRSADRFRPFMRDVVDGLVDAVAPVGRADAAVDICEPYPIPIICELLGAPKEDWQLFSRLANDILDVFSLDMATRIDSILQAQEEMDAYTRALIERRRDRPADDLLTDLIAAEEEGDRLSEEELVMMVNAVIIGGTDTTRNQLGCALALFAEHPDQWALLAERPELAPRAVEETMRHFGAVRGTMRFASVDIEYRDVLFPAGTFIGIGLTDANHDPAAFDQPDVFDITVHHGDLPQMTFGSGIHYCLGQALARAELQEALPLLARRLPNLRLDGEVEWKPDGVGIFGPAHLPVRFDPGH